MIESLERRELSDAAQEITFCTLKDLIDLTNKTQLNLEKNYF
jgi:hypothetical protein